MADTNAENLNPLPLGLEQPAPTAPTAPTASDSLDPTEAWMQEHPADKDFSAAAPSQASDPAAPDAAPAAAPTTPEAQVPPSDAKPAPAPQATAPDAAPTVATPDAAQPATAPQPKTLASDEKIALSDGVEWTRSQIVEALKERHTQAPLAKEGDSFRKLFGMPFEEAQKAWGPVLQRLATEPSTTAFLDGYLSDPTKAAYLEKCASHYDQQVSASAAPVAPQAPVAKDPELAREVAELRSWREGEEKKAAQNRLNSEWAQVTQKYPFLAQDAHKQLRDDLILTAQALFAQDNSKGLLDALELKRPMYEAMQIARSSQPAPAPTPAPEPVAAQPAILGSPGASPNGARPAASTRPKTFGSLDDAVDDWASNPPTEFK